MATQYKSLSTVITGYKIESGNTFGGERVSLLYTVPKNCYAIVTVPYSGAVGGDEFALYGSQFSANRIIQDTAPYYGQNFKANPQMILLQPEEELSFMYKGVSIVAAYYKIHLFYMGVE